MKAMFRSAARSAGLLLAYTVVGGAVLAAVYAVTHNTIQKNEDDARRKLVAETLTPGSYNNDLLQGQFTLPHDPLLGNGDTGSLAWQAREQGIPVAVVLEATAPDGYGGEISLLVGVTRQGNISGVRVVEQHETPGLGDYIELAKSRWIHVFDGRSLSNTTDTGWQVKKDGGQFDYVTGATVTPRAVVKAVHHALQYVAAHQKILFSSHPGDHS